MRPTATSHQYAGIVVLALLTVTFAIFFIGMPRYLDDLWYSIHLKPWLDGVPGAPLWQAMKDTWTEHMLTDNVRLANMVCVPFMILPKWVGSGISALLWGVSMAWGARLAGLDPGRLTPLLSLGMCLWAFFMPWYDSMGVENFQFNYIWPTFLAVLSLRLFFSDKQRNPGWVFAAGLLTGLWHEGFTAPLLASFCTILTLCPHTRNRSAWWLTSGLALGMVWMLAWPTSWQRVANVTGENEFGPGRVVFIAFQHPALLLMLLTAALSLCRRKWREQLSDTITLALIVSALASAAIHFATTRTARTGWWAEYCAVITILRMLGHMCPRLSRSDKPTSLLVTLPLLLLTFTRQTVVDIYAIRIREAYDKALSKHLHSGQDNVFAEVPDEHSSPLICLYAPDFTPLLAPVNLTFVNFYYHRDDARQFIPAPEQLRRVTATSGVAVPPVPGGEDLHIRELDGRLFMPTDETARGEFIADVDFGYTRKQGVRIIYHPFVSEADGKRYAYLYPWRRVVEMRLGHPRAISPLTPL